MTADTRSHCHAATDRSSADWDMYGCLVTKERCWHRPPLASSGWRFVKSTWNGRATPLAGPSRTWATILALPLALLDFAISIKTDTAALSRMPLTLSPTGPVLGPPAVVQVAVDRSRELSGEGGRAYGDCTVRQCRCRH